MGRIKFAMSLAPAMFLFSGIGIADSTKPIFGIFPPEEWGGTAQNHGALSTRGYVAVEVAVNDLRSHGRKIENYTSISVWELSNSYSVHFSDLPLNSTLQDDRQPGNGRTAIYRIDKHSFAVLGSVM